MEPKIDANSFINAANFLALCSNYAGYDPIANTNNGEIILWLNCALTMLQQILHDAVVNDLSNPAGNAVMFDKTAQFDQTYVCVGSLLREANKFGLDRSIVTLIPKSGVQLYTHAELKTQMGLSQVPRTQEFDHQVKFAHQFKKGMNNYARKYYRGFVSFVLSAHGL